MEALENEWQWHGDDVHRLFLRLFNWLFACKHANTAVTEGKSFCPDCGCGVVFQWVNLRCSGCGVRRDTAYCWGRILPTQAVCVRCGEGDVWPEYLENARPYQIHRARLVMHVDTEYEEKQAAFLWQAGLERMRVWMDGPTASNVRGLLPA